MYSNAMIKKLCRVSLCALIIGMGTVVMSSSSAQALLPPGSPQATGPVPLNKSVNNPTSQTNEAKTNASDIPDEISLFDENLEIPTPGEALITPNNGDEKSKDQNMDNNKDVSEKSDTTLSDGLASNNVSAKETKNVMQPMDAANNSPLSENKSQVEKSALPTLKPGNPLIAKVQQPQKEQDILSEVDNDLFNQMSDIEKQTALLTLELRREKIRTEIDAMKAQRQKAIEEQKNMDAERQNKRLAMEKEMEQKIIEEQTKLRKIELAFEKLRQERLLNAYKEHMFQEEQKWISANQEIYNEIANQKKEQSMWASKYKEKLQNLVTLSENMAREAQMKMDTYKREVNNLQTQISILKARLEAQQKTNPFGQAEGQNENNPDGTPVTKKSINLGDLYVILEITGTDDDINAKLMNRDGQTFLVKKGTKLKTGDIVTEITTTYIKTINEDEEAYLYFASGGVMENEPDVGDVAEKAMAARGGSSNNTTTKSNPRGLVTSRGIPGVSRDMMLR